MAETREERLAEIRARWQPFGRDNLKSVQDIDFLLATLDADTALADEIIEMQNGLLRVNNRRVEAAVHVAVAKETERCAQVAEQFLGDSPRTPEYIAALIRKPH